MAEFIQKTDTLNQGRVKLNAAITDAEKAKVDAGTAVSTSNQAKQIAQTAEHKADSVQAQFDQVVIEGDSSVEAAAARVGTDNVTYPTLKARLDAEHTQVTAQLADMETKNNFFVNVEQYFDLVILNNWHPAIQKAIDIIAALGGGTVQLPAGTFHLKDSILLKYNVSLVGAGMHATTLKLADNVNKDVIKVQGKDWNTRTGQSIKDLTVDGNKSNQSIGGYGILFSDACMNTFMQFVRVCECKKDGIRYISSHNNWAIACISEYNDGSGWVGVTGSYNDNHVELMNVQSYNNGEHGFYFENLIDGKMSILNAVGNGLDGIYLKDPTGGGSVLTNLGGMSNGRDQIRLEGGNGVVVSDIRFQNAPSSGIGLHIIGGTAFQLDNCRLRDGLNNIKIVSSTNISISNVQAADSMGDAIHIQNTWECLLSTIRVQNSTGNGLVIVGGQGAQVSNLFTTGGENGLKILNDARDTQVVNARLIASKENGILIADSRACKLVNINVLRPKGHGILINKGSGANDKHLFSNVHVENPGWENNELEKANAIKLDSSSIVDCIFDKITLSDTRTVKKVDYAIDLGMANYCIVSNSVLRGLVGAVDKINSTSIVNQSTIIFKKY